MRHERRPQETQRGVLGYPMTILVPALSVAFAAFCVWLGVQSVNRRERWAKWTAVGLVVFALYVLSIGPAQWFYTKYYESGDKRAWAAIYLPLIMVVDSGPESAGRILVWYSQMRK